MSSLHLVLVLFLLMSFVSRSFAGESAIIEKITVTGNAVFSRNEILGWMETKVGQPFNDSTLARDLDRISQHYTESGYWEVSVHPQFEQERLTITITEGRRTTVGTVTFEDMRVFPEEKIRNLFGVKHSDVPTQQSIERGIERILRFYEEHGYPFCAIPPPRFITTDDGRIDLILTVNEGPEVRIDAIEIVGNQMTRREVIIRELGMTTGTLYDQRRIEDSYRRLLRSGLFQKVAPPDIRYDTRRGRFVLIVGGTEGETGRMGGIVGYAPGGIDRRGMLTGSLDLALNNLFGTGRKLAVTWGRVGPVSSDITIGYREPWVVGLPFSIEGKLQQTERRGYTRRDFDVLIEAPLSSRMIGHFALGSTSIIPDSTEQIYSSRNRTKRFGIGVTYDTRDDLLNPRRGQFVRVATQLGVNRVSSSIIEENKSDETLQGSVRRESYEVHIEQLLPTFQQQTLLIGLHGVGIAAGKTPLPLSEKLRLGGATTLRGYREEEFAGFRTMWGTGEYRYLFSDRSRVVIFTDVGRIDDRRRGTNNTIEKTTMLRVGYGIGVRLNSQAGVIGIDYGLGQGDSLIQGKLHVRLINRF